MGAITKISDYLCDPVASGILHERLVLDVSKIQSLHEWVYSRLQERPQTKQIAATLSQPSAVFRSIRMQHLDSRARANALSNMISTYTSYLMGGALNDMCPKPIAEWYQKLPERQVRGYWGMGLEADLADFGLQDVMSVSLNSSETELIIETSSINGKLQDEYKQFLMSIPELGPHFAVTGKRTPRHSATYSFSLYPLATSLWLKVHAPRNVPDLLLKFLSGSLNYIWRQEWRTSIVLSAIAVEFILAEIYEEENKQLAPDVPLGALNDEVKKTHRFPPNVTKAISETNDIRIRAVHRGTLEASEREAINALRGAVQLTLHHCG